MPLTVPALVPAGMVQPFAGSTAPAGWLLCYGQAVSRTTYAALFAAIATAFGVGDGSTTFNLPDLRGRVPVGKDDMGGAAASRITNAVSGFVGATLGAAGGAESHTLVTAEMPAHSHAYRGAASGGGGGDFINQASNNAPNSTSEQSSPADTGGGGAHRNVQPSQVVNYIVKT